MYTFAVCNVSKFLDKDTIGECTFLVPNDFDAIKHEVMLKKVLYDMFGYKYFDLLEVFISNTNRDLELKQVGYINLTKILGEK